MTDQPKDRKGIAMVTRTCERCGKTFEVREATVNRGWGRFCGKSCAASGREASKKGPTEGYNHTGTMPVMAIPEVVIVEYAEHAKLRCIQGLRALADMLERGGAIVSGGVVMNQQHDGTFFCNSNIVLMPAEGMAGGGKH